MEKNITIIIPCYNESAEVLKKTINNLEYSLNLISNYKYEIIVINDGSDIDYNLAEMNQVRLLKHYENRGYGAALKTGISIAQYDLIGITDADGTYPNKQFSELLKYTDEYDMVIGQRSWSDISLIRRFPKYLLTAFASFLADSKIPDLNSGMRIFKKKIAMEFWSLYPNGFSFTSTITMACTTNGYSVKYVPIKYSKRIGNSSIQPIRDTIRFFTLITRLTLFFNPNRFFMPLSILLIITAFIRGLRDYILNSAFGGLTLVLFFMSFQVFFFGLLAEIISKTRK